MTPNPVAPLTWKHVVILALGLGLGALHIAKPQIAPAVEGVASSLLILAALLIHRPGAAAYIAELEATVEEAEKGNDKP